MAELVLLFSQAHRKQRGCCSVCIDALLSAHSPAVSQSVSQEDGPRAAAADFYRPGLDSGHCYAFLQPPRVQPAYQGESSGAKQPLPGRLNEPLLRDVVEGGRGWWWWWCRLGGRGASSLYCAEQDWQRSQAAARTRDLHPHPPVPPSTETVCPQPPARGAGGGSPGVRVLSVGG